MKGVLLILAAYFVGNISYFIDHWLSVHSYKLQAINFPDDIFERTFLNENIRISINIKLNFVP